MSISVTSRDPELSQRMATEVGNETSTFVDLLDGFHAVIGRRHDAMLEYLREPHTIADMADHRFIYRPHVELAFLQSVETRSAEMHVARMIRRGEAIEVELTYLQTLTQDAGEYELAWDGRDAAGMNVGNGIYTFGITARDINGFDVYSETYSKGLVTGVSNQYAVPYLVIGERLLEPENVLETSIITE